MIALASVLRNKTTVRQSARIAINAHSPINVLDLRMSDTPGMNDWGKRVA